MKFPITTLLVIAFMFPEHYVLCNKVYIYLLAMFICCCWNYGMLGFLSTQLFHSLFLIFNDHFPVTASLGQTEMVLLQQLPSSEGSL